MSLLVGAPKQLWKKCGDDCTLDGTVVGKSVTIYDSSVDNINSFKFKVPAWQGQFQDFCVACDQSSVNDFCQVPRPPKSISELQAPKWLNLALVATAGLW